MITEEIDTVIIGGGQAGLAASYHLGRLGCSHVILERQRVAERWRSERWDSLTFQFPNWAMQLPGYSYSDDDPDGFAPRDEVVRFIESYAEFIQAPLRCGVAVTSLRQKPGSARFQILTEGMEIEAKNVIVATGPYQKPSISKSAMLAMRDLFHLHSSRYRNPRQLPDGAVLVIGSGNSGCQIAEDLMRIGRHVYLAVGSHRRAPRRYRGRDCTWWQYALGEFDQTADKRPVRRSARLLTGVDGGRDMDLRRLAQEGVVLLGRLVSAHEHKIKLAPDLDSSLAAGDAWFVEFLKYADEYAQKNELHIPEDGPHQQIPDPKEVSAPILDLDLKAAGVSSVIWANGYSYDFGWIELPVFATDGNPSRLVPVHQRGVTNTPGCYFLGLPWLSKLKSTLMAGVGEDAAFIAVHIAKRGGSQQ